MLSLVGADKAGRSLVSGWLSFVSVTFAVVGACSTLMSGGPVI